MQALHQDIPTEGSRDNPSVPTELWIWKNQNLGSLLSRFLPHGHTLFFAGEDKSEQGQVGMGQDERQGNAQREGQADIKAFLKSQSAWIQSSLVWHHIRNSVVCF